MMDVPPYWDIGHLLEMAGWVLPGPIERLGVPRRAQLERATIAWRQRMWLIKPQYGTDSEEEDDDGSAQEQAEQKQQEEAAKATDAVEHKWRTCAEAEQTAAEIMDAFEWAAGRLCWVVYHDGGYTPEQAATDAWAVVGWSEDGGAAEHTAWAAQLERVGWGYMRKVYRSPDQPGTGRPQVLPPCSTEPCHSPVTCYGPV